MGLLDGQVAIVTGAGQGIGRAHALALAAAGAAVVVNDPGVDRAGEGNDVHVADRVVDDIIALGGRAAANYDSVATWEGAQRIVQTALDAFDQLDILVNNAGILRDKTLLRMNEAMWDAVINVHLKGTFLCTRHAAEIMRRQGTGGRIINTSSVSGLRGNFGQANYGAAKAGIYGLTRVASLEFARYDINVNAIAPIALTRMTESLNTVPEHMTPERIAPMIVFLASHLADDITGRTFGVHGNEIFEYRMDQSPAIDRDAGIWNPYDLAIHFDTLKRASAATPAALKQPLRALVHTLPHAFIADDTSRWTATLHVHVGHDVALTLRVDHGRCRVAQGIQGRAHGEITVQDAATFVDIVQGEVTLDQALMSGHVRTTNTNQLLKFNRAFDLTRLAQHGFAAPETLDDAPTPPTPTLNRAWLGRVLHYPASFAAPEETEAYARATGDLNPRCLSHKGVLPELAPPLFVVKPANTVMANTLNDPDLGVDMLNLLHAEQDMRFFTPVRPGDLLTPEVTVSTIEDKSSGQLLSLTMRFQRDTVTVCEVVTSLFIRDRNAQKRKGRRKPTDKSNEDAPALWFTDTLVVEADQPHRYAIASGDHNPIHVDPRVAQAAGLPSVILHGLCTMAFCQRAIVDQALGGDATRLKRLSLRFTKPVLPGDTLTTRVWKLSTEDGVQTLGFETLNQNNSPVISQGLAEILDA